MVTRQLDRCPDAHCQRAHTNSYPLRAAWCRFLAFLRPMYGGSFDERHVLIEGVKVLIGGPFCELQHQTETIRFSIGPQRRP